MAKKRRKKSRKKQNQPLYWLIVALALALLALLLVNRLGKGEMLLPQINPYRAEDFVSENGRITCLTGESLQGIDVSYYQGQIDWQQVRESGIEFAFVRIGYRRSSDGTLGEDELAQQNLRQASEAGIKVGAYFFSQAISPEEAREEAAFALEIIKDFRLDLPVVYDWETVDGSSRSESMTRQVLGECIAAFCDTVESSGYESMVYFNRELSRTLLDVRILKDRKVWFAMYDTYPDAPCKPDYWQYTDKGTVPGIKGYVDLNLYLP